MLNRLLGTGGNRAPKPKGRNQPTPSGILKLAPKSTIEAIRYTTDNVQDIVQAVSPEYSVTLSSNGNISLEQAGGYSYYKSKAQLLEPDWWIVRGSLKAGGVNGTPNEWYVWSDADVRKYFEVPSE